MGETWGVLIGRRHWKLPSSVDSEDSRGRVAVPVLKVLGDLRSGDQARDFQPCDARGNRCVRKLKVKEATGQNIQEKQPLRT